MQVAFNKQTSATALFEKKLNEYLMIAKNAPEDIAIHIKLAELYLKNNNKDKALSEYLFAAQKYEEKKLYQIAISTYHLIISIDPEKTYIYTSLADIYIRNGFNGDAVSILERLAHYYYERNLVSESIEALNKILDIDPDNEIFKLKVKKFIENKELLSSEKRHIINFTGPGSSCVDDGSSKTICTISAGGAPPDAEYVVSTANPSLSAERVCTDTTTIDCDAGTAGQMKFNLISPLRNYNGATNYSEFTSTATVAGRAVSIPNVAGDLHISGSSSFMFGDVASHDRIQVTPTSKGATPKIGTITSSDLTDDRNWSFPDANGTIVLGTPADDAVMVGNGSTWAAATLPNGLVSYSTGTNSFSLGAAIIDPGSNGILSRTALNTVVSREITSTDGSIVVSNGNGVAGTAQYSTIAVIGYNRKMVASADVTKAYEDLLQPKWKGQIGLDQTDDDWYMVLVHVMGEKKAAEFIRNLAKQNVQFRRGRQLAAELLAAGEWAMAPTMRIAAGEEIRRKGAPVDWVAMEPLFPNPPNALALARRAPHPMPASCGSITYSPRKSRIITPTMSASASAAPMSSWPTSGCASCATARSISPCIWRSCSTIKTSGAKP